MGEEANGSGPEPDEHTEIEDPLEKMEAEISRLEKELQYSAAEMANIRQRSARDKSDAVKYGASSLSRKILPLIGSLEKAVSNVDDAKSDAFLNGLKMTLEGFRAALNSEGVTHIDAVGKVFDPTCMEAIATVPAIDGIEPGGVVEVVEEGYMLHERVLRAARVIVAEASVDESSD
ncbi:MAG: nucleotide exchange factor GrpE [Euryarchaeota archaeon]|nr:nucleotide exchange factor GrpE [Euryarchaeota archaeon]